MDFNDLTLPTGDLQGVSVSEQDMNELGDWLSGISDTIPDVVRNMSSNLEQKVNFCMCYMIASNMRRCITQLDFIEEAEKIIYDKNTLAGKSSDEIMDIYKDTNKTVNQTLEFVRKFLIQNKETLSPKDAKVDQLQNTLMSLSPERIDAIMTAITNGTI